MPQQSAQVDLSVDVTAAVCGVRDERRRVRRLAERHPKRVRRAYRRAVESGLLLEAAPGRFVPTPFAADLAEQGFPPVTPLLHCGSGVHDELEAAVRPLLTAAEYEAAAHAALAQLEQRLRDLADIPGRLAGPELFRLALGPGGRLTHQLGTQAARSLLTQTRQLYTALIDPPRPSFLDFNDPAQLVEFLAAVSRINAVLDGVHAVNDADALTA